MARKQDHVQLGKISVKSSIVVDPLYGYEYHYEDCPERLFYLFSRKSMCIGFKVIRNVEDL